MSSRFLKQSLIGASLISITISILGRFFGYVREAFIAGYFGTSETFDIFILAFTVPELVAMIIAASLPTAIIPALEKCLGEGAGNESQVFWSGLIYISFFLAIISAFVYALKSPIISMLAPDLTIEQRILGGRLVGVFALFIFFRGTESYFRGWLYYKKHFVIPSAFGISLSLSVIISILLFYGRSGVFSLAYGWLLFSVVFSAMNGYMIFHILKPGKFNLNRIPFIGIIVKSTAAVAVLESISILYPLVDRYLAARILEPGYISALRYATTLYYIPVGIIIMGLNISIYPWIVEYSALEDKSRLKEVYRESVQLILFGIGFISVASIIFAPELLKVAFQRGAFDVLSLNMTLGPTIIYMSAMLFSSIYLFQMRFYYARKAIFRLGVVLFILLLIKAGLSILLIGPFKHNGLAAATSLAWFSGAALMTIDLSRTIRISFREMVSTSTYKTILNLCIVAVFWLVLKEILNTFGNDSLLLTLGKLLLIGLTGLAVYIFFTYVLKLTEPIKLINAIKKRIPLFGRAGNE